MMRKLRSWLRRCVVVSAARRLSKASKRALAADIACQKQLEADGWDEAACRVFWQLAAQRPEWPKQDSWQAVYQESCQVGSQTYLKLWLSFGKGIDCKLQELSQLRLQLLLRQLGAELDAYDMLQLTGDHTWLPELAPHAVFWELLAAAVRAAFPMGLAATAVQGEAALLAKQLHQLRFHIDRQNIGYIRDRFRLAGQNDEQALACYVQTATVAGGLGGQKMIGERGRLHNKFPKGASFNTEGLNRKRLTPNFHSEFILDSSGYFVTPHDILAVAGRRLISDPAYYRRLSALQQLALAEKVVNGESFNYAQGNDRFHRRLDIRPPGAYDFLLRKQLLKKWQSPKNHSEYRWSQLDRGQDGYSRRAPF